MIILRSVIAGAFVATLAAVPALSQERYVNEKFGFSFDIPQGFVQTGAEFDNGDGLTFTSTLGSGEVIAFGGNVVSGSFEAEINQYKTYTREAGWTLTYETSGESWAVYSGLMDGRILYTRFEAQCSGNMFAAVQVTYDKAAKQDYDPLIEDLMYSLERGECAG